MMFVLLQIEYYIEACFGGATVEMVLSLHLTPMSSPKPVFHRAASLENVSVVRSTHTSV
jgi:hypothetical protein